MSVAKMLVEWLDKKPEEWIDAQEGLGEIYAQAQVDQHTLAGGRARVCPECDSEIAVCMMGHYCGEKTPAAKA